MPKDRPLFVPPRKRQNSRRNNNSQNYIDHIVTKKQTRNKLPPSSPRGLEDDLVNTSLLLKNKQPLPKLPDDSDSSSPTPCKQQIKTAPRLTAIKKPNNEHIEFGEIDDRRKHHSLDKYERTEPNYLTMSGTIKRGRKKGQTFDLQVNISQEELENIHEITRSLEENKKETCNVSTGFHVFIFTLLCLPFVTIITTLYSFYIGTLTWYNVFTYFNEEKSHFYKLFLSPLLIIFYPIFIVICAIGLGLYAGAAQLSLKFSRWLNEVADIEKGFYGWLCGFLKLCDCSPYEVVILSEIPQQDNIK